MKLNYYNSTPNVGDALNPVLFDTILYDYFHRDSIYSDYNFYGIGTLIFNYLVDLDKKNIFFGTGLRDLMFSEQIPKGRKIDFRFVRGPLSSKLLDNQPYITDPAYLAIELSCYKKIYRKNTGNVIGVIPYFTHQGYYNSLNLGKFELKVISPLENPETFILKLAECDYIFTGAMHGAILADLLRIPWCRLKIPHFEESTLLSEFKWSDWLYSMSLHACASINIPYTFSSGKKISSIIKNSFIRKSIEKSILKEIEQNNFTLSNDKILESKIYQLREAVDAFKKDYPLSVY